MAEADDAQRPIIIRRKKVAGHAAHGGAWKIAYADFVTAMMAFFLLMWLLGSTSEGDLQGIAAYFKNPMKVSLRGGPGSGSSSSVIQGGGNDFTRQRGQVKQGEVRSTERTVSLKAAQAEIERLELNRLEELKGSLDNTIDKSAELRPYREQLLIDITSEGLRVQVLDEKNRPMFELGGVKLLDHTKTILRSIGKVLNEVPNRISLAGHTDATQYAYGERAYSNWELSSDRANASRRELVGGGLEDGKVIRVVGLASSVLFNANDPYDPVNRRISIVVLNKKTERAILNEGVLPQSNVGADTPVTADTLQSGTEPQLPGSLAIEPIPEPNTLAGEN